MKYMIIIIIIKSILLILVGNRIRRCRATVNGATWKLHKEKVEEKEYKKKKQKKKQKKKKKNNFSTKQGNQTDNLKRIQWKKNGVQYEQISAALSGRRRWGGGPADVGGVEGQLGPVVAVSVPGSSTTSFHRFFRFDLLSSGTKWWVSIHFSHFFSIKKKKIFN